jgi:hypothetical protein
LMGILLLCLVSVVTTLVTLSIQHRGRTQAPD